MLLGVFPLVLEDIPVPSLSSLHIHNRRVSVLHRPLLDPWLNLLLSRQLQHLLNLPGSTNSRASNLESTHQEGKGVDRRKLATVRSTNLDEGAVGLEQAKISV